MAQEEAICALHVASGPSRCVTRSSRASEGAPKCHSSTTHVDLQFVGKACVLLLVEKTCEKLATSLYREARVRVNGYFTNRYQLPPRYPGGSAERRRVCLEDTKKDRSASDTSSRSGADGGGRDVIHAQPRAHPAELQVRLGGAPVTCRCGPRPRPSQGAPLYFPGCACNMHIPGHTQRSSRCALGARLCHPRVRLGRDFRPHKAHPGAVNPAQRAPCAITLRLCARL